MTTPTLYPCREQQSTAHTPQCSPNELFYEQRAPIVSKMQTLTPAEVSKKGGILLANSNQLYFNNLVKTLCHKTSYRCPHRLNLTSQ